MALTESTMLPLGAQAPDFTLPDVRDGQTVSLDQAAGEKGTLVMFICSHCPFVVHIQEALAELGRDFEGSELGVVAISSNDPVSHPRDSKENLVQQAEKQGFVFPYLLDESQEVAKAYKAACTPDFFLFDADRKLVYRGQFDSSRPESGIPVTGEDLRSAIAATLEGRAVSKDQKPSIGCNIKWKPGAAPDYAG